MLFPIIRGLATVTAVTFADSSSCYRIFTPGEIREFGVEREQIKKEPLFLWFLEYPRKLHHYLDLEANRTQPAFY